MIEQNSSTKTKILPFFVLSVCIHLSVLFAVFYNGHEKDKFIQIPIDVGFISPVETGTYQESKPAHKNVEKQIKQKEEKVDPNSIKIEKKKKRREQRKRLKDKKEEHKEEIKKEKKKDVPVKNEQNEVNENKTTPTENVNPFNTSSSGSNSGVMFENKNFKFAYYSSSIVKKIKRNWIWSGSHRATRAIVYFKINRDGDVIVSKIKESSGNDDFDNNALRAVQLSSPFAPLPEAYSENDLGVYFEFKIN